jgi:hypothetical protein
LQGGLDENIVELEIASGVPCRRRLRQPPRLAPSLARGHRTAAGKPMRPKPGNLIAGANKSIPSTSPSTLTSIPSARPTLRPNRPASDT